MATARNLVNREAFRAAIQGSERQGHGERRPLPGAFGPDGYGTAEFLDDKLRDVESQADAFAGRTGLMKAFERALCQLRIHAAKRMQETLEEKFAREGWGPDDLFS